MRIALRLIPRRQMTSTLSLICWARLAEGRCSRRGLRWPRRGVGCQILQAACAREAARLELETADVVRLPIRLNVRQLRQLIAKRMPRPSTELAAAEPSALAFHAAFLEAQDPRGGDPGSRKAPATPRPGRSQPGRGAGMFRSGLADGAGLALTSLVVVVAIRAVHGLHPVSLPGPGRPGHGQLRGQARPGR